MSSKKAEEECNAVLEEMQETNESRKYSVELTRFKRETTPEDFVVDTFLVKYKGRFKVWHKDGDESNNWYKNLITVSVDDYKRLKAGNITWQELNLEQEYIEYENKASSHAYKIYDGILARCGDEEMDVDKDLFGDGSGMYAPHFCCLLPKGLNTMPANSKKHYKEGETPENTLPLGVRYNSKKNEHYSEIQFTGTERSIPLSEWDTAEEAFAEYKIMKQADICMVSAKYKENIPDYIYDALLKVEVRMY